MDPQTLLEQRAEEWVRAVKKAEEKIRGEAEEEEKKMVEKAKTEKKIRLEKEKEEWKIRNEQRKIRTEEQSKLLFKHNTFRCCYLNREQLLIQQKSCLGVLCPYCLETCELVNRNNHNSMIFQIRMNEKKIKDEQLRAEETKRLKSEGVILDDYMVDDKTLMVRKWGERCKEIPRHYKVIRDRLRKDNTPLFHNTTKR